MSGLTEFSKKHDYLVCLDSDGTVMNTMDIKHIKGFGPCLVEEWGLEQWKKQILERWNDINLYTKTRGINRFKGLIKMLEEINEQYCKIEDVDLLKEWTDKSEELSASAMEKMISGSDSPIFKKALSWSRRVDASIEQIPEIEMQVFTPAADAVKAMEGFMDIAVVSSANAQAIVAEWEKYGLRKCVDIILTQEDGSKADCLKKLLDKGYKKEHILMVGDAPGDFKAAMDNGVLFYPILVKKEAESWKKFDEEALNKFRSDDFKGDYQKKLVEIFDKNLEPNE